MASTFYQPAHASYHCDVEAHLSSLGITADAQEQSDRLVSLRRLLETELTVANDNNTYPNTTLNVRLHAKLMSFPAVQHHYRTPLRLLCPSRLCLLIVKQLPNTSKFYNSLGDLAAICHLQSLQPSENTSSCKVGGEDSTDCFHFLQVGLSRPEGCIPWWTKTIRPTDLVCPKDCALSGFKEGYNLGRELSHSLWVAQGAVMQGFQ